MRPQILLLTIFLTVLPLLAVATVSRKLAAGPWEAIKDVHDPHVQAVGKFAVTTFNSKNHTDLVFKDIRRGETQADRGTKYFLHLLMAGPVSPCYVALVLETPGQKSLELLSFERDTC
ncbi:cysteine proteinase inhibitor 6 [Eucalyptus grandis]|uniref:cysteine proteinase inhibitor 6 n=1 Tax=Eucalyptus grandis TaxID=71139 RepID=UPI0005263D1E|nr:cysteine proteinase inhibitor 6 [Eucalyptus grandis]